MKNKVIAVVGPTASGKTTYAIDLAKEIDAEIVSADSRLVYKGFDIGTAKPSLEEQNGVVHHMIDVVSPEINYSVALYKEQAKKIVTDILSRGKTPIIVGGSGLYINALLMNYDLPEVTPDYELRKILESSENLYDILLELDSEAALNIEKNDKRKIIRTIEVIKSTNLPISRQKKECDYEIEWIGRNIERAELYHRINRRVDLMVESGLVQETESLLEKHGRIDNLIYTIGYQEMVAFLDGHMTLNKALERLKQNTRRYAKRQLTWFRKNPKINWNYYPKTLKK